MWALSTSSDSTTALSSAISEAGAADLDLAKLITAPVRRIKEIKVLNVADRTLLIHQGERSGWRARFR